jgi:hypothetical protein
MEARTRIERVVDGLGPGHFWGIYCFTAGWALAALLRPIPVDSAAVKLVASILGPAIGAGFAILGTLKVVRETGKRESRRAIHHLHVAQLCVWVNNLKADEVRIGDLMTGRGVYRDTTDG